MAEQIEYLDNGTILICNVPEDENGFPVERTIATHPYSYDAFVTYRAGKVEECNGTVYSDRLFKWNPKKHNRLCKKHFGNEGQYWNTREPKLIEAFLQDYVGDKELKLILVMEGANQSSGFPYWIFWYNTKNNE